MALVSLVCPQCGAALELDDKDRDYGFCGYCGCKVQLHEVISVKHSGTVSLDNSAQATNRLQIANRAFESHNFSEASDYYTKVLEDLPGDYKSICRKGICAVYLSAPGSIAATEFSVAMKAACQALNTTEQQNGKSGVDLIAEKDRDLLELLDSCVLAFDTKQPLQASLDSCNAVFARLVSNAVFASTVIGCIDTESIKETALVNALEFCSNVEKTTLKYHAGSTVEKNGNVKNNYENCRISGRNRELLQQTRASFADAYNTLPSRLEKERNLGASIQILNDEIKALQKKIAEEQKALKASKTAFWNANPDFAKGRRNALLPALIIGVLSAAALTVFVIYRINLGVLLAPAGIILAVLLGIKMKKSYEKNVFSEDIRLQTATINADENELKEKKEKLAAENSRLKEFNRSKR